MELLVPIKDKNNAIIACNLKAGALYCSGPLYSARHKAGISFEDLNEIIEYAHLYDVKVYITLNTLIKDDFFSDVIEYIDKLVLLKIDALIIQDIGLLNIVKERYPNLDIHISTQMHIHNIESVAFVSNNKANRIVLARELSIQQIKAIKTKHPNLELETFIHGALCTSYSGQCYYSHFFKTGSGNFGTCQQNCRLNHTLANKKEYLLNLRDLCVDNELNKLHGISDSLKIEGRLKGSEYLYSSIKFYRSILNGRADYEMYDLMQIAFNRTYTKGRLFNKNGYLLGNKTRINNHGLLIGEVTNCDGTWIYLRLDKQLTRLDNIRLILNDKETGLVVERLYENNSEVEFIKRGNAKIKSNLFMNNAKVFLVRTKRYDKEINTFKGKYYRKNLINAKVTAYYNKPIKITIDNYDYFSEFKVEKAKKNGMSLNDIRRQLSKTNNTPFTFEFEIEGNDDLFVAKSLLNEFRRIVIDDLIKRKLARNNIVVNNYHLVELNKTVNKKNSYMIRTIEQAKALSEMKINEVYIDNIAILEDVSKMFKEVIPVLPRVIKDDYFDMLVATVKCYDKIMVSELGMLNYFKDTKIIETNYSLNTINRYALSLLKDNNVSKAILSLETSRQISIAGIESSRLIYGYIPLMIMDYCPINQQKVDKCDNCSLCRQQQYYVYDDNKRKLPLIYRGYDMIELYSDKPLDLTKKNNSGFISFTIEDYEQTKLIVSTINKS